MKIIVLHGDDTQKSYLRLKKFIDTARERSWEIEFIDDPTINFEEILSGNSLFGNERIFILRNVKKVSKKQFEWMNKNYKNLSGNLIIYNEGTLGVTVLKELPKDSKIEEFKLPVLLWNFLDRIAPGNPSNTLVTFHKIIEKSPPEFVFTLIARQIRDLYWIKADPNSSAFPSWRASKLKSQASLFTIEKLQTLLNELSLLDIKVKSSKTDLVSSLDLLIIKHLE